MRSDLIILEALENAAAAAVDRGALDESVYDREPRSHVFYPDAEEPWDDDDVVAVKTVGEHDVAAKIGYWRSVLDGVTE